MRSPTDLAEKLTRQWQQAIGKPTGGQMAESLSEVRRHVARRHEVTVGEVV